MTTEKMEENRRAYVLEELSRLKGILQDMLTKVEGLERDVAKWWPQ